MSLQILRPNDIIAVDFSRHGVLPVRPHVAGTVHPKDGRLVAQGTVENSGVPKAGEHLSLVDILKHLCAMVDHDVKDDIEAAGVGGPDEFGQLFCGRGGGTVAGKMAFDG